LNRLGQRIPRRAWRAHGPDADRLAPEDVYERLDHVAGDVQSREQLREHFERRLELLRHRDGRAERHEPLGLEAVARPHHDRQRRRDRTHGSDHPLRRAGIVHQAHDGRRALDPGPVQALGAHRVPVDNVLAGPARDADRRTVQLEHEIGDPQLAQRPRHEPSTHTEPQHDHVIGRRMLGFAGDAWRDRFPRPEPHAHGRSDHQQRRGHHHRQDARAEKHLPGRLRHQSGVEPRTAEDERELADLRQADRRRHRDAHRGAGREQRARRRTRLDEDEQRGDAEDRGAVA
jgi:hypothetical protein